MTNCQDQAVTPPPDLIYVASRATKERAAMWKAYRQSGHLIISTWIDEVEVGATNFMLLWDRVEREIARCDRLVFYAEPDDFPFKGALVEVGMALAYQKPVVCVLPGVKVSGRTHRPVGSWIEHRRVWRVPDLPAAMTWTRPFQTDLGRC